MDSEAPWAPGELQAVLNPLITEQKITASDGFKEHSYTASVSQAGDIDGDGYPDLVVGAWGDKDIAYKAGAAYVYYGSASGIDPNREDKLTDPDGVISDFLGNDVSGGGDLNGDGYDDLVVGAYGLKNGAFYVYYGASTGIQSSGTQVRRSTGGSGEYFALNVSNAGDLNGDGYGDVVAAAHSVSELYIYYGSASGLDTATEQIYFDAGAHSAGQGLAGQLDVNADGYGDLLVGDSKDSRSGGGGSVTLYKGSAAGLVTPGAQILYPSDGITGDYFGEKLGGVGDVNGDGFDDVAIGSNAPVAGSNSGAAYVYLGSTTGLVASSELKISPADGAPGWGFGSGIAGGDVDGDGYSDVLVGAQTGSGLSAITGAAYVYFGSASGIDAATEHKIYASDGESSDYFGYDLTAADFDQDGYSDLLVGALNADEKVGAAYLFGGGCRDQDEDGFCTSEGDCLDLDASAYPGASEAPGDGIDQNCDGQELCLADPDLDGFVDGVSTVLSEDTDCEDPGEAPATAPSGDCDPDSGSVYPGAEEVVADGVDQDCDGGDVCYADQDDDGYSDTRTTIASTDLDCEDSGEATATQPDGDCMDDNPEIHPDADEVCDGWDNDCDGTIDVNAVDQGTWYPDVDQDGFGDALSPFQDCFAPFAYIVDGSDCDDADPDIFPGAEEIPGDGVDQDCDGADTELPPEPEGCGGCSGTGSVPGLWGLVSLGLLFRRRR